MRTTRYKKIIDLVKHKNMIVSSTLEFEVTKVFGDLLLLNLHRQWYMYIKFINKV